MSTKQARGVSSPQCESPLSSLRKLIRELFLPPLLQRNTTNKVALKQTAFHDLWLR